MRSQSVRSILDAVSTVAMTAAAAAMVWSVWSHNGPFPRRAAGAAARPKGAAIGLDTTVTQASHTSGNARLALVEFTDFQCPFCAQFAKETYPRIHKEFVEPGKIDYVVRSFPLVELHPFAVRLSQAAECAGQQNRFWDIRERLFDKDLRTDDDVLVAARRLLADPRSFRHCFEGAPVRQVTDDQAEGKRLGVTSTPTFFIGRTQGGGRITVVRTIEGAVPYETFRTTIQELLAPGQ